MAQGRSTKIISMMKWIRTSRVSIKKSLSSLDSGGDLVGASGTIKRGLGSLEGVAHLAVLPLERLHPLRVQVDHLPIEDQVMSLKTRLDQGIAREREGERARAREREGE